LINIIFLFFLLFLAHSFIGLEKIIYANEILSLGGLLILLKNNNNYLILKQDSTIFLVLLFLFYTFFYSIYSFFFLKDGTNYEFLRTLPITYSIPSFFLGIEFYKSYFLNNKFFYSDKHSIPFSIIILFFGPKISTLSLIPLLFNKHKHFYLIIIFISFLATLNSALFVKLIFIFVLFYFFILKLRITYLFLNLYFLIFLIFIFFISLGYFALYEINNFYNYGYSFFRDYYAIESNITLRIFLWIETIKNSMGIDPFFGIGFGTKIFDPNNNIYDFILVTNPNDPHLPYTLGLHNSYLFILVRFGLIGFLLFLLFNLSLINKFFKFKLYRYPKNSAFFISFSIFSIAAFSNVILESPLYSSTYWIIAGLFYQSLKKSEK